MGTLPMNMETVRAVEHLSTRERRNLGDLYRQCNAHDATRYEFDDDPDFQHEGDINTFLLYEGEALAASLTIFAPMRSEGEVIALTAPTKRRRGYFNILVKRAQTELIRRGAESLLFVCDGESQEGRAQMRRRGAKYEYSEFQMVYKGNRSLAIRHRALVLEPAGPDDLDAYVDIQSRAFQMSAEESRERLRSLFTSDLRRVFGARLHDRLVGMIVIYEEPLRFYIHGFCIDPDFQRRGLGHDALTSTLETCLAQDDAKDIVLEVQTENGGALNLYRRCGFRVETEYRYYRESLPSMSAPG